MPLLDRACLTSRLLVALALTAPAAAQPSDEPAFPPATETAAEAPIETPAAGEFEPPANLTDALERATAAVRKAEKGGVDFVENRREAAFYVQEAFKLDPENKKAEFISGRLNRLIGRSRDAFRQVMQYLDTPEGAADWEAFKILADLHYEGEYYVQAEAKYLKAAQLAPNEPAIALGLCRTCIKLAKRRDAIQHANRAIQLDPLKSEHHEMLAEALIEAQQFGAAKAAIQGAINQTRIDFRNQPGDFLILSRLQRQNAKLQEILRSLIENDGTNAAHYLDYVASGTDAIKVGQLMAWFEQRAVIENGIRATKPQSPPQLIEKYVELSSATSQFQKAIELLEEYVTESPQDQTVQLALESLRAASVAQSEAKSASADRAH